MTSRRSADTPDCISWCPNTGSVLQSLWRYFLRPASVCSLFRIWSSNTLRSSMLRVRYFVWYIMFFLDSGDKLWLGKKGQVLQYNKDYTIYYDRAIKDRIFGSSLSYHFHRKHKARSFSIRMKFLKISGQEVKRQGNIWGSPPVWLYLKRFSRIY